MSKNAFTQPIAPTRANATETYTEVSEADGAEKTGTYGWIEEPSTDAKENPDIDKQRKPESQRDVQKCGRARRTVDNVIRGRVRDLGGGESEREEKRSTDKLAQHRDEQVADPVWQPGKAWQSPLTRVVRIFGVRRLHSWKDHEAIRRRADVIHDGRLVKGRVLIVVVRSR